MPRAFLSLGSNLGDRLALLREALERLARLEAVEIVGASPLYEAEPWESEPGRTRDETRWYLNCVVAVETTLPPRALLERVQAIETALGRTRPSGTPEARRFAARTLDIDILFYGREVVSVPDDLHIPHLLLAERPLFSGRSRTWRPTSNTRRSTGPSASSSRTSPTTTKSARATIPCVGSRAEPACPKASSSGWPSSTSTPSTTSRCT